MWKTILQKWKWCSFFFIYILWFIPSLSSEYISKLGNDVIQKSTLIIRAKVQSSNNLGNSASLVKLKTEEIYWGSLAVGQVVSVLYPFAKSTSEQEWVVFLQTPSSQSYYSFFKEFPFTEDDGEYKVKALAKILAIESLDDGDYKQQQYVEFCLAGLNESNSWERWNAYWEWNHYVNRYPNLLTTETLEKLTVVYQSIPELSLKENLQKSIVKVKRELMNGSVSLFASSPWKEQKNLSNILRNSNSEKEKIEILSKLAQYPNAKELKENFVVCLHDDSAQVRSLACFYLRFYATPEDIPILIQVLKTDSSLVVRKHAIYALAFLDAKEAKKEIEPYRHIEYTRIAASKALNILDRD